MNEWIQLHKDDHVVVALRDFKQGEAVDFSALSDSPDLPQVQPVKLLDDVPKYHKILIKPVSRGAEIRKYGCSIGRAKSDLQVGSWVHVHNLESGLQEVQEYVYSPAPKTVAGNELPASVPVFQGYVRENGDVGIRNEIWIINTVGCINKTCELLAKKQARSIRTRWTPSLIFLIRSAARSWVKICIPCKGCWLR